MHIFTYFILIFLSSLHIHFANIIRDAVSSSNRKKNVLRYEKFILIIYFVQIFRCNFLTNFYDFICLRNKTIKLRNYLVAFDILSRKRTVLLKFKNLALDTDLKIIY